MTSKKRFVFEVNNDKLFECNLVSEQCACTNKNGTHCKRKTVIGTPYCYSHLLSQKKLRIKKSGIANAGQGLYAQSTVDEPNDIIFKKGQIICNYEGEVIDNDELEERYGNFTGPYALTVKNNVHVDCACDRGVASLANNYPGHNNATIVVNKAQNTAKIKATKNIRNNEEIFLAYGSSSYGRNEEATHSTK